MTQAGLELGLEDDQRMTLNSWLSYTSQRWDYKDEPACLVPNLFFIKKNYEVKQQQRQHPYQMEKNNDDNNNIATKEAKGNDKMTRSICWWGRKWVEKDDPTTRLLLFHLFLAWA